MDTPIQQPQPRNQHQLQRQNQSHPQLVQPHSNWELLTHDLVFRTLSFLKVREIYRFSLVNQQYLGSIQYNASFWQMYCGQCSRYMPFLDEARKISEQKYSNYRASTSSSASSPPLCYVETARIIEGLADDTSISLLKRTENERDMSMEGHAGCLLLNRYLCIVGGWGPDGNNFLHMYDCVDLPSLTRISTITHTTQRFKYGFTVVPLCGKPKMLMFGGCTMGGYSGDCNGMMASCRACHH
jgi:hypothetical protein